MSTKPLKVGIIGSGVIAPTHVQSYQLTEAVEVAWACDLVPEKAAALADKFGIARTTTDVADVLDDPEVQAISVCTDHASHASICAAALKAGKDVICEKALSSSVAGLEQMFAAHESNPDCLFAGIFQHRYDPVNRCLHDLVSEGIFGQMLTAGVQMRCLRTDDYYRADQWRGTWELEGGAVLINQAIHYIDLLVWIMGGVEALSGMHENLTHGEVMETEDTAVAALRFKSGALGTLEATCSSHINWEPTLSLHGSTGSLDLRHDQVLKIEFADSKLQEEVRQRLEACRMHDGVDAGKSYYGTGHPAQIADFVDAIRERRQPFVTAASARHTVEVVLGIYEANRKQAWVRL